jgi:hypothetical protein
MDQKFLLLVGVRKGGMDEQGGKEEITRKETWALPFF